MEQIVCLKNGPTRDRWERAIQDRAFDSIRDLKLVETSDRHFFKVLATGKTSSNIYLRRIHNFSLGMDWLLKPVLPRRAWPKIIFGKKRGITSDEHRKIIDRERNPERRDFYELLWRLRGSQSDVAQLHAEDVDWSERTIGYNHRKLLHQPSSRIKPAIIHFGEPVAEILRRRPSTGPLFPYLSTVRPGDRATEFKQRCGGLGIHGVSLHSYRYAWAERARQCGFPLRFAQEALGHNSKAVHHAYASKAEVKVPSLDVWEKQMKEKIVDMKFVNTPAYNEKDQIPESDAAQQGIFDQGHEVGALAKSVYRDGIEVSVGVTDFEQVLEQSLEAVKSRKPLFEAGFVYSDGFARVDILNPVGNEQWDIIEVKSATGIKDVYLIDLAFQAFVYTGAGLKSDAAMSCTSTVITYGEAQLTRILQTRKCH